MVASGTAGAQMITMMFAPVITRIYGPEAFGLLGVFTGILTIVMPLAALAYPLAIVLPKQDSEAKSVAMLSLRIALCNCLVIALILLLFGNFIAGLLRMEDIANFMLLIPLAMFFSALLQIMQQWLIRKKQFNVSARVAISQSIILNLSKVGLGIIKPIGAILIILSTFGYMLYAVQLWFGNNNWAKKSERLANIEASQIHFKNIARKYRDFPFFRAPQNLLDAFSQSMPLLMMSAFYGASSAGFYALARMVLSIPIGLIGTAVGNVFYPYINEARHHNVELSKPIVKATLLLGAVGIIPFGLIILFGPWLFGFVFGSEWIISGEYARWLSIWLFFAFCNRPTVATIPVLKIQHIQLMINIIGIVLRAIALLTGFFYFQSEIVAIALFSTTYALMNVLLIGITLFKSKNITKMRSD